MAPLDRGGPVDFDRAFVGSLGEAGLSDMPLSRSDRLALPGMWSDAGDGSAGGISMARGPAAECFLELGGDRGAPVFDFKRSAGKISRSPLAPALPMEVGIPLGHPRDARGLRDRAEFPGDELVGAGLVPEEKRSLRSKVQDGEGGGIARVKSASSSKGWRAWPRGR